MPADDVLRTFIEASSRVRSKVSKLTGRAEAYEPYGRGAGGDISRKIDIVAEREAIDTLKEHGLKCAVITEESGTVVLSDGKPSGYVVLDAVDGTANALRGLPFYCCSIAFADEYRLSAVKHAVVMDLFTGDVYSASKGNGAFVNGARMQVSKEVKESYVVGMNLSGVPPERIEKLKPVMSRPNHVRHFGANALELCIFARGLIDVFIDLRDKIRVTDMAAAYLIVREAGGILISENGNDLDSDLDIKSRLSFIAAANKSALSDVVNHAGLGLQA